MLKNFFIFFDTSQKELFICLVLIFYVNNTTSFTQLPYITQFVIEIQVKLFYILSIECFYRFVMVTLIILYNIRTKYF